jgi:2-dehydropantoate 2-reductase
MRLIVIGAGAIGGTVAARAAQQGLDVQLVARGAHGAAIAANGLRYESPTESVTLQIPVVDHPGALRPSADDVVLLAVKAQDTAGALEALAEWDRPELPIACAQNGVSNEPAALRWFRNVQGVLVVAPAVHLEPGIVQNYSAAAPGILDVGRYPSGIDATSEALSEVFQSSGFVSQPREDIMAWKYRKLVINLTNALEVVCGTSGSRQSDAGDAVMAEGRRCLAAAGITVIEEPADGRPNPLTPGTIGGSRRPGSSTLQSVTRGVATEVDFLNGEIVRLGRELGIATPLNELLQRLVTQMSRDGTSPGLLTEEELLARAG